MWFEAYPDRYERELQSLQERGLEFTIDEEAKAHGVLRLLTKFPHGERQIDLEIVYPDLFPYAPPEVNAPGEAFKRHQHPQGGNLCLIGRNSLQWNNTDTIGDLLEQRLTTILQYDATHDVEAIKAAEDPQGEPISEYFNAFGLLHSYALYDSSLAIPEGVDRGRIVARTSLATNHHGDEVVHMAVQQVLAANGDLLHETSAFDELSFRSTIKFPWFRLPDAPTGSTEEIHKLLEAGQPPFDQVLIPNKSHPRHFFALIYDEEIRQFQYADGLSIFERRFAKRGKRVGRRTLPVRTFRAGPQDLAARIPSVASLADRKALLVGLGALGSEVAMQLARNGIGKLTLLDGDFVEPSSTRRWALGVQAYGESKVYALHDHLNANYPQTHVDPVDLKIGSTRSKANQDQFSELLDLVEAHDVVIDLSADLIVDHVLSDLCRLRERPFVLANATPGAWGGMVYQWLPFRDHACWMCLRHQLYNGEGELPPADPAGEIQPPGCAARTFTGTSFDLGEISLELIRVVSGIWDVEGGYPRTEWQLAVCKLRNAEGARLPPTWEKHEVARRIGCACGAPE